MNKSFLYLIKAGLFAITTLIGVLQISGCGQKGPLYLPDEKEQVNTDSEKEQKTEKNQQN